MTRHKHHGLTRSVEVFARNQREELAIELRVKGHTLQQIADALGYKNAQSAKNVLHQALARNAPREWELDLAREIELRRIDFMVAKLMERVEQGDMDAVDKAHKWEAMRIKLLGLDAPTRTQQQVNIDARVEATTTNTTIAVVAMTEEYTRLMNELVDDEVASRRASIEKDAAKKAIAQHEEMRALEQGIVPMPIMDVVDAEVVVEDDALVAAAPVAQEAVAHTTVDVPNNVVLLHAHDEGM